MEASGTSTTWSACRHCQIGTFRAYVAPAGHALIDRHLYLPDSWPADHDRCQEAGIAADVELLTKPRIAIDMLQRAFDAQVPFTWFTADEAFGQLRYLGLAAAVLR